MTNVAIAVGDSGVGAPRATAPPPAPSGPGCGRGDQSMTDLSRIISALEDNPTEGAQALDAARLGFLEWVFAAPGPVTARMARDALDTQAARGAQSPAARAFVGCVRQACSGASTVPQRRRGARATEWIN